MAPSDTLAEVRLSELFQAVVRLPRDQAERMVEQVIEEEKLRVLAAIVILRAAMKLKEAGASAADPGTTGGIRTEKARH